MKIHIVFAVFAMLIFFLTISCSSVKDDSFECKTIADCPLGFICSEDGICVEDIVEDEDQTVFDQDQTENDVFDKDVIHEVDNIPDIDETELEPDENDFEVTDSNDETVEEDVDYSDADYDNDFDGHFSDIDEVIIDEDSDSEPDFDFSDEDITVNDDDTIIYDDVIIGTGVDVQWAPIGCRLFSYTRSAGLYLSAEIGVSAPITKLAWYDENNSLTSRPIKIYLKETTDAVLSAVDWPTQITDAVEVFSGEITTVVGWNEMILTAPFNHSGTNNLLVLIEMNKNGHCNDEPEIRFTPAAGLHSAWNEDYVPTGNGNMNGSRPDIKISF